MAFVFIRRAVFAACIAVASLSVPARLILHAQPAPADPLAPEQPFIAENEAAMTRMMAAMAVAPSGDVDRDFVAMMIPHHQGAIDMATAFLRHGHNEQLRRMAQEIIVTQTDEIRAMRLAIGTTAPAPSSSAAMPMPNPTTTTP